MALTKATLIDLNANELILDLDADTSITSDSDDTIDFRIGGSDEIKMTSTALTPAVADGSALGTAALEWADLFLADAAVINLGADQDVTLTHVHNEGLLLNSTMKLEFNDASQFIQGSSATVLSIGATDEIDLTATLIDINGNLDVSGTVTIGNAEITEAELEMIDGITGGTVLASKAVVVDGNKDIGTFRNVTIDGTFSDGNYTFDTSGNVSGLGTIGSGAITSTGTVAGVAGTFSGVLTGTTVEATADTSAGDNAAMGYTSAEGLILTGQGSTSDITLKNDADATVFTVPTGTDDILFPDSAKTMWGAGSDLQIYHDGSNSYIHSTTGDLVIRDTAGDIVIQAKSGENSIIAYDDGQVELYYDNSKKIETTTLGATISGTVIATTDTDTSNTGSVTLDFGANQNFVLTLTGNVTLANPSTEQVGQSGFIAFIQDGTGSRTITLGTDYETAAAAGLTLTSTASATDLVPYLVVASNRILLGTPQLAFA